MQTIFGVHEVPSDTQRRESLDGVAPAALRGVFPHLWEKVRRAGWGRRLTTTLPSGPHQGPSYTVALDGSEYFRSPPVHGPHCLRQLAPQGRVHYAHKSVGATGVRAGAPQVLPLEVEEVRKATAESAPQDCELTAGTRLIARVRREHPQRALIVIGDDLDSHVPFVEPLQQLRQPSGLVAKPSSPLTWLAAVAAAEGTAQTQTGQGTEGRDARQRTYPYRLVRPLPLALESAVRVTDVEVWEHPAQGALR